MALLTAIGITAALIADFLLLPALLIRVDRAHQPKNNVISSQEQAYV